LPCKAWIVASGFFLLLAAGTSGQESLLDRGIRLPRQKTTLYDALNQITQKTGCLFIYDSENVSNNRKVRIAADSLPLRKLLDNLLNDPALGYKVIGNHVLICRESTESRPVVADPAAVREKDSMAYVVLRGHIYDKKSGAAIPYATIGILEENIGTVTNSDGFFMLKIPSTLSGTSLIVSHLGFLSQQFPVKLLDEQRVDIFLERRVISIQEVIIRYLDPWVIISKAMEQRNQNYAVNPVYLTAFYREGVRKNNTQISYSEAVFKVYKSPVDVSGYADQVKLLKSRKIQHVQPGDTVYLKLKAGVQSALQLDIVKCIPGFLDQTPPVEYAYRYAGLVSFNDKDAYAITFSQTEGLNRALYSGTVYIAKEGFVILGGDFEINPGFIDLAVQDLVLQKSLKLKVKLEKISYSVSYMHYNGRYYLRHVRCDIGLKTRLRHWITWDRFNTFLEFATCGIDTTGVVKFPRQETLKPQVIFSDQPFAADDDFWEGFNVITSESKLTEELSKIIGKIEEIR
jgi:hypothetical protein